MTRFSFAAYEEDEGEDTPGGHVLGMSGLGDLPDLDSVEVRRLGAQALRLMDHPRTREELRRLLQLPDTSRAVLLTARVLRHLQNQGSVRLVDERAWARVEERRRPAPTRESRHAPLPLRERGVVFL